MFDISENLKKLPDKPGVYMHKDKLGQIIYVGKAISLKNRVRQYFQAPRNQDAKTRSMVGHIAEFEYITTGSEMEALILECNLIKKHKPKYNIILRDDKTYPYIEVTTEEEFPRVIKTRIVKKDSNRYFGPYSDVGAVNSIIDLLNEVFKLKRCARQRFPRNHRPCLNKHIGQCEGICTGTADSQQYQEKIKQILDFLKGRDKKLETYLTEKMNAAAEQLDYETAAEYRDYLLSAKALSETQRVVLHEAVDIDVVMTVGGARDRYIVIFFVRDGKLSGRETYYMEHSEEDDSREMTAAFIKQHYSNDAVIPAEILVSELPPDSIAIEAYLSKLSGRSVTIHCPQRGEKRALLELIKKDTIEMTKTVDERAMARKQREADIAKAVREILSDMAGGVCDAGESGDAGSVCDAAGSGGDEKSPTHAGHQKKAQYRIEAYDISNTNGVDTVGAMVVFDGLKPDKKSYRKFKVRTIDGPNDYGSMQEVLIRRFRRALEAGAADDKTTGATKAGAADEAQPANGAGKYGTTKAGATDEAAGGFARIPDLLLIDGGHGHVTAATAAIKALGLSIPIAGMAKDDRHRTKELIYFRDKATEMQSNGQNEIINCDDEKAADEPVILSLKDKPMLFKYIGTIQEEVHRFAIDYHRNLRSKRMTKSVLDEIPGIGPVKRNALLAHFGSVENIKNAGSEKLQEVEGITSTLAIEIESFFK